MAQTDRQTDKPTFTHWKSAIYDCDDANTFAGQWKRLDTLPDFVKTLHRKNEICPKTGREHVQIHVVCHRQVRLTQLSGWIKHTKWFGVAGTEHIKNSINYIYKVETTAPGAVPVAVENEEKYLRLSDLLLSMASYTISCPHEFDDRFTHYNKFPSLTRRMIEDDIVWANKLSNPTLPRFWKDWGGVFIDKFAEQFIEGTYIIEGPPGIPSEFQDYNFIEI